MALEAQFEELIALTAGVVDGCVVFGDTVRDTDHSGRLERPAGERAFVSSCCWIRIDCVDAWAVTRDSIGGVCAVRAIESIKEGVKAAVRECFDKIVDLIEGDGLRLFTYQFPESENSHTKTYINQREREIHINV